jgi:DNA-binding MarR family transcriptional regulator
MNEQDTAALVPLRDMGATPAVAIAVAIAVANDDTDTDTAYLAGTGGLVCALLDAARAISGEVEARAGDAHMTVAQARLARHFVHSCPGIPMTELTARSGMTAPATTLMLRRMTDKGLVRRSESASDGRTVLVGLTERGQQEFRAIAALLAAIDSELGRRAAVRPEALALAISRLVLSALPQRRSG